MTDELGFRCRKNLSFRPFLNGSTASMKNIPSVQGDTQANTFVSCGVVLLAAVLTGSHDAKLLEDLLHLPAGSIALALRLADVFGFWWT
jgi:hypothetical protein